MTWSGDSEPKESKQASVWDGCPVWGVRTQAVRMVSTSGWWPRHGSQAEQKRSHPHIWWPRTVCQSPVKRHPSRGATRAQAGRGGCPHRVRVKAARPGELKAWAGWGGQPCVDSMSLKQGRECSHGARGSPEQGVTVPAGRKHLCVEEGRRAALEMDQRRKRINNRWQVSSHCQRKVTNV